MPRLTKRFIDLLKPSPDAGGKDLFYWDDDIPGYGLRLKPSGVKSYIIQYRKDGRSRRMTLGRHGVLTAEDARKLAKLRLGDVAHDKDPAQERADARRAPTMRDLAEDYLERHAIPNKRPSSVKDDRSMLDKTILPKLGPRKVKEIGRRDIETLHNSLVSTPYRANRVRALLSKMFSLSVAWGWRDTNPVLGIPKFQELKRDRWLSEEELARLFEALRTHPNQRAANIVRLLVLTGARKTEVMSATWDQFDLDRGVWTKPSHTTKQKQSEHTPLSSHACDLIREIATASNREVPYVFPGDIPGQPITDIKKFWHEVRAVAGLGNLRVHDLRHTFASHLVSSGVSLPIVGRLLGHTQPQTTQRYSHFADDPLRQAVNIMSKKFDGSSGQHRR